MSHRYYYYDYRAGQGHTALACRDYFDRQLRLLPRVLMNVTDISLKTTIFGYVLSANLLAQSILLHSSFTYENPIMIAPTTFHCLAHAEGEVATARGASEAQCCYTYNWMYSTKPEAEVLQVEGL